MTAETSPRLLGSELTLTAWLCTTVCCALLALHTGSYVSTNPASRLATMDALVHDGTFVIDKSQYKWTIDRIVADGHNYSTKPPLLSTVGAGVYWVLLHTTGLSLRDPAQRDRTVFWLNLIVGGVPHLLLLWYGYRVLRWFAPDPRLGSLAFASLSLGQLGLAFSTTINNHVPAAAATVAAFYYAFGLRRGFLHGGKSFCCAGFAAGLAPTLDLGAVFFSASIGLYLLTWDVKQTLRWFVPLALIPVLVNVGLTWSVMGSPLPTYLRPELYDYPGSYWNKPRANDALDEPRMVYLFHMLLGHHGLFSMTPVVAFGVYAMVRSGIERAERALEALVIGGPLLVMIVFYTLTTKNYGGNTVGFRWLMPAVPISLLFVSQVRSIVRQRTVLALFLACLTVSQFHAYSGFKDPWEKSPWERWLKTQRSIPDGSAALAATYPSIPNPLPRPADKRAARPDVPTTKADCPTIGSRDNQPYRRVRLRRPSPTWFEAAPVSS